MPDLQRLQGFLMLFNVECVLRVTSCNTTISYMFLFCQVVYMSSFVFEHLLFHKHFPMDTFNNTISISVYIFSIGKKACWETYHMK